MTKLDTIDQQIADLEASAADLEQQHASILEQIAAKFGAFNEKLTAQAAQIRAQLESLPIARQTLRDQRDQVVKAQGLAEYERLSAEMYAKLKAADELNAQIAAAQKVADDLRAKQRDLHHEANGLQGTRSNLHSRLANKVVSTGELKRIQTMYSYTALSYPHRAEHMAKRAERGELPPGEMPPKPAKNGKE